MADTTSDQKNVVRSVAKCFRVLESFSGQQAELLLSEVARNAGLDNATAFRLLNTLVSLGYVARIPDTRRFRLTLKCLDLGFNAIARMDLRSLAQPILRSLLAGGGEAASIGVLDGGDAVFIDRLQPGMTRLAVNIRIGTRVPAYCSSVGRAILAFLPEKIRNAEMRKREFIKITPWTVTDPKKLARILDRVRVTGVAIGDQETIVGVRSIAAPILGADDAPIAAVSIATTTAVLPVEEFVEEFAPRVKQAAAQLGRALMASGGNLSTG